jgi:SAM-dependent MidA family methyltransferase
VRLSERLRERIAREGPISFQDFMEAALYDPVDGYYARAVRIGEGGDFATSPAISPLFARTIAKQFRREAEGLEGPMDFVEVGAGRGGFLAEFARTLRTEAPALAARLRLTAIERAEAGRKALATLPSGGAFEGLRVLESAGELPERSIRGWIFSNELYDALPVIRVREAGDGLEELRVEAASEGFRWTAAGASDELRRHLADLGVTLAPDQVAEVSLQAAPLHRSLARSLAEGSLVAFDYGHRSKTLYHPLARPDGTLAVHSEGRRGGNPLDRPGEVDLTAHVNWDDLIRAGEAEGLTTGGLERQGSYLVRAGLFGLARTEEEKWRAFRLVDPEGMGDDLSVLVQTRLSKASHH